MISTKYISKNVQIEIYFGFQQPPPKKKNKKLEIIQLTNQTATSNACGNGRCSGGGGIRGGATDEGQESGVGRRLLFVQEQIFRNPKRTVSTNQTSPHHHSRDQDRSDTGKEKDEDAQNDQDTKRLALAECAAEYNERLIGGAKEVEEDPGGEESDEHEERERIGDERESNDDSDDREVIDSEIGVVLADAEGGFGERLRFGEGGSVGKFGPWAALGEAVTE